jgi:hypothetical protein
MRYPVEWRHPYDPWPAEAATDSLSAPCIGPSSEEALHRVNFRERT